jgi:hypothetical protein
LAAYEADTTQGSFPVLYRAMLKKLKAAGCGYSEQELGGLADALNGAISYTKATERNLLKDVELKRLAIVYLLHVDDIKLTMVWCPYHFVA